MKKWIAIVLYIGALLLQPFLYNLLPGPGVTPNLILILTVVITLIYEGETEGLGIALGVLFSLITDISYGLYIGPGAVAMLIVGLLVFFLKRFANKENIINAIIIVLIATWAYATIYWIVYLPFGNTYSYVYAMKNLTWQLGYNLVIAVILYLILIKRAIKHRRDRYFR